MSDPSAIQVALDRAVAAGVFPGAVLAVRSGDKPIVRFCAGQLSTAPPGSSVRAATVYDLASLTKPLATVTSLVLLIQKGQCRLDACLADYLEECEESQVGSATLRDLLTHQSGLPGWRGYYERLSPDGTIPSSREERQLAKHTLLDLIRSEQLVYARGSRSLYSDLGFMLLGMVVERASGISLNEFFSECIVHQLGNPRIQFVLGKDQHTFGDRAHEVNGAVAPTEVDPWRGRLLCGEVHDQNAGAMGGVAGHAGLFGNVDAVMALTDEWLRAYHGQPAMLDQDLVREFTRKQLTAGPSSWALGWDTPSAPSSAGSCFSAQSFGHLGYTGTSIWVDPVQRREVVLLSNRVHPTSRNEAIREFRPVIHDLVCQEF
ncbi:MAG TPA: serine hydrolase domain-containing protein [Nitrospira sp.]|nr:serine hydrolase domain-containing protein [Nitrospira sp.]